MPNHPVVSCSRELLVTQDPKVPPQQVVQAKLELVEKPSGFARLWSPSKRTRRAPTRRSTTSARVERGVNRVLDAAHMGKGVGLALPPSPYRGTRETRSCSHRTYAGTPR